MFFQYCCQLLLAFWFELKERNIFIKYAITEDKKTFWPGLHNLWQPGSQAVRKWGDTEKMKRKWRENDEKERDSPSTFSHFLYFLPFYPFPISKLFSFCRNILKTFFLSRTSQKNKHAMRNSFLRESSASYEGLRPAANYFWLMAVWFLVWGQGTSFKYAITEYKKSFWQSPEIDWILPIDARISSRAASSRGMVLSRINAPLSIIHICIIHNP